MYLLIAISLLELALLWVVVRGRAAQVTDPVSAGEVLLAVDLGAFRNLIDPVQERFLRRELSRRDYRRVQRARVLAIAVYLRKIAHNASVMLRLGEAARDSHDPVLSAMGAEMASNALSVRLNCLLALAQAYAGVLFPTLGISVGSVVDRYDRLAGTLGSIGRSWTPAAGLRA